MPKKSSAPHLIDVADGYTRPFYLAEVPRVAPPLRFTARPMIQEEVNDLDSRLFALRRAKNHTDADLLIRDELAKRVKTWDAVYPKDWSDEPLRGRPVPINRKMFKHLPPIHQTSIYNILVGVSGGDEDPEATDAETDEYLEGLKREDSEGGPSSLAADQKN